MAEVITADQHRAPCGCVEVVEVYDQLLRVTDTRELAAGRYLVRSCEAHVLGEVLFTERNRVAEARRFQAVRTRARVLR